MTHKKADLAGDGIGNYEGLEEKLPWHSRSMLIPKD